MFNARCRPRPATPAAAATQAPAKPAKVTTIRIGHTLAAEHPVTAVLTKWGENLAQQTGGAFKVEVHPGGVLGSGRTGPEGVSVGTVEAFWSDPTEYASFNQALNIMSAPFMWIDPAHIVGMVDKPAIFSSRSSTP